MPQNVIEMLWEIFLLTSLTASGIVAAAKLNLLRSPIIVSAPIIGFGIFLVAYSLQLLLPVSSSPLISLAVILAATSAYLVRIFIIKNNQDFMQIAKAASLFFVLFALLVPIIDKLDIVKFHYDSYEYVVVGDLLFDNEVGYLTENYIEKRQGAASIIHSIANTSGIYYLQTVTPILGLTGLATVMALALVGLRPARRERKIVISLWALLSLILLLNPAFLWNLFYINSHVFIACIWLMVCGAAWLKSRDSLTSRQYIYLQSIMIPALSIARPEGFLLAALPIFAMIYTPATGKNIHLANAIILALGVLVQKAVSVSLLIKSDNLAALDVRFFIIALVSLAVPLIILLLTKLHKKSREILVPTSIFGAYALFFVLYLLNHSLVVRGVNSTTHNLLLEPGGWWLTTGFLAGALLIACVVSRKKGLSLAIPITSVSLFLPLYFAVRIFIEQGAFRVSWGDSLHRSFTHVLFVLMLCLLIAITPMIVSHLSRQSKSKKSD